MAAVIKKITAEMPGTDLKRRIHVVQHADWNEEVTSPDALAYVKFRTTYHMIPDGNAGGNGTQGLRVLEFTNWKSYLSDPKMVASW